MRCSDELKIFYILALMLAEDHFCIQICGLLHLPQRFKHVFTPGLGFKLFRGRSLYVFGGGLGFLVVSASNEGRG